MAKIINKSAKLNATISEDDIKFFDNNKKKEDTKLSLKQFVENNKDMLTKLKSNYSYESITVFLKTKYDITTTGNTLKTLLADTGNIYSKMDNEKLLKHYEILCQKLNIKSTTSSKVESSDISSFDLKKLTEDQKGDLFDNIFQLITPETHPTQFELVRSYVLENTDFNIDENLNTLLPIIKTLSKENISKVIKALQ